MSDASIILEASEYIKDLKQKVVRRLADRQEMIIISPEEDDGAHHSFAGSPTVRVEALGDGGFLVKVSSSSSSSADRDNKSCCLVSALEAFEELGLAVLHARSCSGTTAHTFRLEAAGGNNNVVLDEHVVKQAVLRAFCKDPAS